ncbi:chromosome segregation protein SMC [Candidatus Woesearchaeota archaeon]|nr:chromosome segregation protein SMC [Candidatus Woesearchaeota archaeon]
MTKINKLVMHGFKSFAKRTELLFGGDFNCILGPNGSGKSNVLDALCFVLGKSSTKQLRAEKSTNLIYNGGKTKKPSKWGEVSIWFDNSNNTFPTDEHMIKISRIVKKEGGSVYKINDKKRTRQQILDLMSVAKIDPNGYNIILQGDIVRFVEMHPVERRQIMEEISGISVYEDKKQSALRELGKVEEKLNEADIVLKERKGYLKELRKDRDKALKYREAGDKVKQNKASYLKIQIDRKQKKKDSYQKRINEAKAKIQGISEEIEKLRQKNSQKKEEIEKITKEVEERGEIEQVRLNKEIEQLKVNLARNNTRVESLKGEINKIKQRREELNQSLEETDQKIAQLNKSISETFEKKASLTKERDSIEAKLAEFREKNKLDAAGDIDKQIEEIDRSAEEKQNRIHELREQQQELLRNQDQLNFQINNADEKIEKVRQIEKEHADQLNQLKKMKEEFKKSTLELNKLLDEDSMISAQIGNARQTLLNANEELAKLKAKTAGIQETVKSDMAVKKILSKKSDFPGVYGTVSDLGNVNKEFSLALEIAAGPRLKSIVVEDEQTASDAIKYLKKNKLGTATFLPLSRIKGKDTSDAVRKLAKSSGVRGVALDLIDFDPKFKKVFQYVFANTLVVDDIDSAVSIGVGKAKMVALDGDLCEHSGVMQGGFRQKKQRSFGFKQKEMTQEIDKYEDKITETTKTVEILENRKKEVEEKIEKLRERKASLEGEIIKTEKSLHLESGDIEVSLKLKEDLKKELKKVEKQIDDVSESITDVNKELAQVKIKKQNLRDEVSKLRSPTLIAELNSFEQKKSELNEEIVRLEGEAKNTKIQIDDMLTAEKDRITKILKNQDKEEEDFRKEIDELNELISLHNKELEGKEEKARDFYAKFKGLFQKRSTINHEVQKNELDIGKKESRSREIEKEMNLLSLENAKIGGELAGLEQDFEQYRGVELRTDLDEEELKKEISRFERMVTEMGNVNMRALEIYEDVEKEYNILMDKKEKLVSEKEDVEKMMNEIETKKKDLFMRTFNIINENFRSIFKELSTKGDAFLELEDSEKPFEGGALIKVRITGDKFLDIRSLSGGEKTMTALAFIFSIQEHEPASFYVLDEVDAALDKHNSEKLARLVRKYAKRAQYVMISHNDQVISEADNLYGVSMDEHGMSKVVSLKI